MSVLLANIIMFSKIIGISDRPPGQTLMQAMKEILDWSNYFYLFVKIVLLILYLTSVKTL